MVSLMRFLSLSASSIASERPLVFSFRAPLKSSNKAGKSGHDDESRF
jgi:hypothetical protein